MNDNTMIVQVLSLDTGIAGSLSDSSIDVNIAPQVEIVITSQQMGEESTLKYLESPSMISVWGNISGDRIVARILLYSNSSGSGKP